MSMLFLIFYPMVFNHSNEWKFVLSRDYWVIIIVPLVFKQ